MSLNPVKKGMGAFMSRQGRMVFVFIMACKRAARGSACTIRTVRLYNYALTEAEVSALYADHAQTVTDE